MFKTGGGVPTTHPPTATLDHKSRRLKAFQKGVPQFQNNFKKFQFKKIPELRIENPYPARPRPPSPGGGRASELKKRSLDEGLCEGLAVVEGPDCRWHEQQREEKEEEGGCGSHPPIDGLGEREEGGANPAARPTPPTARHNAAPWAAHTWRGRWAGD